MKQVVIDMTAVKEAGFLSTGSPEIRHAMQVMPGHIEKHWSCSGGKGGRRMGKSLYCGLLGSAGEVRRSRSCRSIKKIRKLSQVSHQLMAGELGWKEPQMEYYSPCP